MPCWRTSGSSLRFFPPWGRHRLRVRMFWVQSPRSFRTPWEPSDRRTGWLGHQSHSPRNTVIPSPARKRCHLGRLRQGHQSSTAWGLLLPSRPREQWQGSRPFALAPAGEPATDPIPKPGRSLASRLELPQPDSVDGSQVGGCLADFAPHWLSLLGNCRATGIVEDGVGIAFQQRPQLTHQCISFRTRNSCQDLQQAVDALLLKGAIERFTNVTSLGYYSRLFLVPKKTGDLRPVIDLSTLNRHMVVPHCKMETQGSVRSAIRSQEWTVSIDIHDAYLHVPMHQAVCKYLRFVVNKQVYRFTLSPLRVSNFSTRVHQAAAAHRCTVKAARCEATHLLRRLADQSRYSGTGQTACPDNHQCAPVSRLDHQLREVRPHSKSGRLPVHRDAVQYSTIHSGAPTEDASQGPVRSSARDDRPEHHSQGLHRLLRMFVFMASLERRGSLRLRQVQWWAATAWCQRTGSWSDWITVPQWVLSEVAWWASPAVLQGLPLTAKETEVTLFTDASSSGWGAQLGSCSTRGQWSASQRLWHINALEMQAVINAVREFEPHLRSRVVRLMCDNAVTVAYIKNEGGTRLHTLMQMTIGLLNWCDRKAITLVPVLLPGVHNIQVDSLSRVGQTLTTEWTMAMERLRPVFAKWGEPQVDLFVTTHQVCITISGPQGGVDRCHVHAMGQREGPPARVPAIQDVPRRSDPAVRRGSRPADSRRVDRRLGDRDSSLPAVKSTRVETLRAILRVKGHSKETAHMMSRSLSESWLQVYESHWARFVAFRRSKRWQVFRVRSHHFSTYMMHLFRNGLLPSTIISHRTYVASVLRHWVYDPADDPHIKLLFRAFRLERPVQRRIMPKWDLHLVLLSLPRPPFASDGDVDGESSDDVIPQKWQTMKCVFLLALASARWRSYLHALSVAPGRCVFARGNTQRQLVVSLLPKTGFLAKNQLPTQAPEWITVPEIAHLNPTEAERMLCPVRQLKLYIRDSERIRGAVSGCLYTGIPTSEISWGAT